MFNFKRIRFTKPSARADDQGPSQAGEDLPQAIDLGVVAATSASTRSIDVQVSAPCVVRSTVPWLLVQPDSLPHGGRWQLSLVLQTDLLVPGALIEACIDLEMSSAKRTIRVHGWVDESWAPRSRTSVFTHQEPWTLARRLKGHVSSVRSVAFLDGGQVVASGSEDCTVRWWDLEDDMTDGLTEEYVSDVWTVGASRDGHLLAVGLRTGYVILHDALSRARLWERQIHKGFVSGLAFSSDSSTLISSSGDRSICFTDARSGQATRQPFHHRAVITSLALSGNGLLLATTSQTRQVLLWDLVQGLLTRELNGHTANVWSVAFSLDGYKLASGSNDHSVCIWDAYEGRLERQLTDFSDQVFSVAVSPDGRKIATASGEPKVRIWDAQSGGKVASLQCGREWIKSLAFSPDGRLLAGASNDSSVYIWRVENDLPSS